MTFLVIIPAGHLVWILLEPIRVSVPTTAVGDIDDIDSKGWSRAFSSLFSVLVVAVLHLLLLNSLKVFRVARVLGS